MGRKSDLALEWLSNHLPFGNGKAHLELLDRSLEGNIKTVLDIGCGRGTYNTLRQYESVGIEIFPANVEVAKKNGNYRRVIQGDMREIFFPDKSFDAVICVDAIEHVNKEDGWELLDNIERMARKTVVIITAWGYQPIPMRFDNPALNHRSGWFPEEFISRGYEIHPFRAIRWHWGNNPVLLMFAYVLSIILRPLIVKYPEKLCNDFAAIKRIKE